MGQSILEEVPVQEKHKGWIDQVTSRPINHAFFICFTQGVDQLCFHIMEILFETPDNPEAALSCKKN